MVRFSSPHLYNPEDFRHGLPENEFAKTEKNGDFSRGEFNYDKEWTTFPPTIPDAE